MRELCFTKFGKKGKHVGYILSEKENMVRDADQK